MASGTRKATAVIAADNTKLDRALGRSQRQMRRWAHSVKRDVGRSLKSAFSGLQNIVGFGGVAGLAVVGRDVLQLNKQLARLGIQAGKSSQDMEKLRQELDGIATQTGVQTGDLLSGVERFVSLTGDFESAADSARIFADVAAASGASLDEIASTAAALNINMGLGADQMEQAFSVLIDQGKAGAVELKEMATLAADLTPMFEKFGNAGTESLAEMGALLQTVRSGFGTSEKAATGLQALMTAMIKNAKRFREVGVNPFEQGPDGERRLRKASDIIFDLLDKTKGNEEILTKVLGRVEATKAILPLLSKGRAEVERLVDLGLKSNAVQEDAARFQESTAGRIARAQAQLKVTLGDSIARNADQIAKAMEAIADAIGFIVRNPLESALTVGVAKMAPMFIAGLSQPATGMSVGQVMGKAGGIAGKAAGAAMLAQAAMIGTAIGTWINKLIDPLTDTAADKSNRTVNQLFSAAPEDARRSLRRAAQIDASTPAGVQERNALEEAARASIVSSGAAPIFNESAQKKLTALDAQIAKAEEQGLPRRVKHLKKKRKFLGRIHGGTSATFDPSVSANDVTVRVTAEPGLGAVIENSPEQGRDSQ